MATQKQIDANRRNAQKSTGPVTDEGKAIARLNATQHGIYATLTVIDGEHYEDFEALYGAHLHRWQPTTPEEHVLVESMIQAAWTMRRLRTAEVQLWDSGHRKLYEEEGDDCDFALVGAEDHITNRLMALQRRLESADRMYRRNLELLLKLRKQPRPTPAPPPTPIAKPKPRPKPATAPQSRPRPPLDTKGEGTSSSLATTPSGKRPLAIGFVPSTARNAPQGRSPR